MIQKIILCAFFYFICSNIAMAEDSRGEFTDYLLELQQKAIATGVNQLTAERYIANIKIFKNIILNGTRHFRDSTIKFIKRIL